MSEPQSYEILSCKVFEDMAKSMVVKDPKRFSYHATTWDKFPDGTDHIKLGGFYSSDEEKDENKIQRRHVLFLASFHNNDVILQQLMAFIVLLQSHIESLTIVLPFYPVATMERVEEEGVIATANCISQIFSGLPSCGKPIRLMIYDIHTLQNRFYFNNGCIANLVTTIPLLKTYLRDHRPDINCIAFPDDGASKRFGKKFKKFKSQVTCAKKREGDKRHIIVAQGNCDGQHVLIVDDLVQTGGTLLECANALLEHGALSVSCYVAHAIFPNKSWQRFLVPTIKQFITTNSYPQDLMEQQKSFWHEENRDKFVVLNIEELIVSDL